MHWSGVHDGVNVELAVPERLRLTVHVNDHTAVDTVIGEPLPAGWPAAGWAERNPAAYPERHRRGGGDPLADYRHAKGEL